MGQEENFSLAVGNPDEGSPPAIDPMPTPLLLIFANGRDTKFPRFLPHGCPLVLRRPIGVFSPAVGRALRGLDPPGGNQPPLGL